MCGEAEAEADCAAKATAMLEMGFEMFAEAMLTIDSECGEMTAARGRESRRGAV